MRSSTDFDAAGWPMYSAQPAEGACNARREAGREENSSFFEIFLLSITIIWTQVDLPMAAGTTE
jgi:hypothetical protein